MKLNPCITLIFLLSACTTATHTKNLSAKAPPPPAMPVAQSVNGATDTHTNGFMQALDDTLQSSHAIKAAQADLKAQELQHEALAGINGPWVFLGGTIGRYALNADIDTGGLKQNLTTIAAKIDQGLGAAASQAIGGLVRNGKLNMNDVPAIQGALGGLPKASQIAAGLNYQIPDPYHLKVLNTYKKASINAIWPIFTGGKLDAIKDYAGGKVIEARSGLSSATQQVYSTLIERYYGVQLAKQAAQVRLQAVNTLAHHEYMAQQFYKKGLIAKTDLLKMDAAYANAKAELVKAQNKLNIAQTALDELLPDQKVNPSSPLFISTESLKDLSYYQDLALKNYPGFQKIAAKQMQLNAKKELARGAYAPNVTLVGRSDLNDNPNWFVGVNMQFTLWSGIDRDKMIASANAQQEQINQVLLQAQSDIQLFVKQSWLEVKDAVARYRSFNSQVALAQQQVKLATKGFKEGVSTALDLIDANTFLAKVETERAQAAYQYIVALAHLFQATGTPELFLNFQSHAQYISKVQ